MPEVPEVNATAQYLAHILRKNKITGFEIISGRYTHQKITGLNYLTTAIEEGICVKSVNSKGKFLWMVLKGGDTKLFLLNTFGLTGYWTLTKQQDSRLCFEINGLTKLYFNDTRNFGTIKITKSQTEVDKKLAKLGEDLLSSQYTWLDIQERLNKIKNKKILEVIMNQEAKGGIGSGIGNYLSAEILYDAKISPHRKIRDLSEGDIKTLTESIKRVIKMAYIDNIEDFKEITEDLPKFKDYLEGTKLTETFQYKVYRKDKDPLGNPIKTSSIIKSRTTYWVESIQK